MSSHDVLLCLAADQVIVITATSATVSAEAARIHQLLLYRQP